MAIYYENGLWLGLFRDDFREEDLKVEEKQIQVRKGWWRQRCGHVVHVTPVTYENGGGYRWECVISVYYDNGRTEAEYEGDEDLVEFLGEEIEVRRVR